MIKSISISGPESSGKSWLTKKLAEHYKEPYSIEYAREFIAKKNGLYSQKDLVEIAKGQILSNKKTIKKASRMAFNDTCLLDIKVWSIIKYETIDKNLLNLEATEQETYHILCAPNIEYEKDALRENPDQEKRNLIYTTFLNQLKYKPNFLGVIDSKKENRLKTAIDIIESKLNF